MPKSKSRKPKQKKKTTRPSPPRHFKLTNDQVDYVRMQQGGKAVLKEIAGYNEDDFIILSFFETHNDKAKKIARMYDQQLLDAKLDQEDYLKNRFNRIKSITEFVLENNLLREWIDLAMAMEESIQEFSIANAYMTEILDTWVYMERKLNGTLIGITSDGKPLTVKNPFGDWDIPLIHLHHRLDRGLVSQEELTERMNQLSENFNVERNENIWTIERFQLIPFINERTVHILPDKIALNYASPDWTPLGMPLPVDVYKDAIKKRTYMIGKKGAKVNVFGSTDIEEVYFMEDIDQNNELVMIYRFNVREYGEFTGYYRPKRDVFFSPYAKTTDPHLHNELEPLILGIYAHIIGEPQDDEMIYEYEGSDSKIGKIISFSFQASTLYGSHQGSDGKKGSQRPHLRSFAIRKLGEDREASDEAKQRAREYGIELQEGYTFVRSYAVGKSKVLDE